MKSVFIAIPSYGGIKCAPFFKSLESTLQECEDMGWKVTLSVLQKCCYVQVARNKLVNEFMKHDCGSLFFLDDDISWLGKDFMRLLEMEDEIVAGIYPTRGMDDAYPVVINTDEERYPITRDDGCIQGFRVPAGFLRIKKSAIEKLVKMYPQQRYEEYEGGKFKEYIYDFFPQGLQNGRWIGEDFAFCRLWTDIGGEIWIVPDIDFIHHSTPGTFSQKGRELETRGNYHQFLLRQPGGLLDATKNRKAREIFRGGLVPC